MQNYSVTEKEHVMNCIDKHNDMHVKHKTFSIDMESLICRENMITSKRIAPNIRTLYRNVTFNSYTFAYGSTGIK